MAQLKEPTFVEQPDSSKLERNAWVRKGLKFSWPVASFAHASQSSEEICKIEDTTETEICCISTYNK